MSTQQRARPPLLASLRLHSRWTAALCCCHMAHRARRVLRWGLPLRALTKHTRRRRGPRWGVAVGQTVRPEAPPARVGPAHPRCAPPGSLGPGRARGLRRACMDSKPRLGRSIMPDIPRQASGRPAAISVAHTSETRSEHETTSSAGRNSPGRRRRMSSIDGPRSSAQTARRTNAPDAETNALLRERFAHHLVTQVKLSSVVRAESHPQPRRAFSLRLTAGARWRLQTPLVLFTRGAGTRTVPGACGPRLRAGDAPAAIRVGASPALRAPLAPPGCMNLAAAMSCATVIAAALTFKARCV